MKKFLYICLVISFSGLMFQSVAGEPKKENKKIRTQQQADTLSTKEALKKKSAVQSGWLNSKYFPQLRPSPCPFFVQPGC